MLSSYNERYYFSAHFLKQAILKGIRYFLVLEESGNVVDSRRKKICLYGWLMCADG